MAYNNYFPTGYQPAQIVYQPQYQQPMQQVQQSVQPQIQQTQNTPIQQSGFVRVQSENDARMYPVAPGNSITFIDDNAPYCYVKTMDISQLDRPKFEKYRLVKEEAPTNAPQSVEQPKVDTDITEAFKREIEALWGEIEALKARVEKRPTPKKKEVEENE